MGFSEHLGLALAPKCFLESLSNGCVEAWHGQLKYEGVNNLYWAESKLPWDRATCIDGQHVGNGAWQPDTAFWSQPLSCSRKQGAAGKSSSLYWKKPAWSSGCSPQCAGGSEHRGSPLRKKLLVCDPVSWQAPTKTLSHTSLASTSYYWY